MKTRSVCVLVVLVAGLLLVHSAGAQVSAGTDSAVALTVPAPVEGFTIAIIADRTTGVPSGLRVLQRTITELNLLKPDLVIHIGDFVEGYERDMVQWEQDIVQVRKILGGLPAPLFPLAGNHDVITGTGDLNDHRGEQLYKKYFGPLYYAFDYRGAHFICLYTDEALQSVPHFSDAQLQWLRDDLARTKARSIFVFLHKPVWEYPGAGWDAVHEMLKQHPVRCVIAGHLHNYYKSDLRDGIQYYVLGATGGTIFSPEPAGGLTHYCLLRVMPDSYSLALVRPGNVLPDDYVRHDDYKDMEKLRFLTPDQTGVPAPVRSPELGAVNEQVVVQVANPLARALDVEVRGYARGGAWTFHPAAAPLHVEAGARASLSLGISAPPTRPMQLVVPQVEVQYTYVDSQGRQVALVLPCRIPVHRELHATVTAPEITLDAADKEDAWQRSTPMSSAVWQAGPFETGEAGPVFRLLPTASGLYFYADSPDATITDFRGSQILCDALFVGVLDASKGADAEALKHAPVVVIYPFGPAQNGQAVRAPWDAKRPVGPDAPGVRMAVQVLPDAHGWRCEGFVPWDVLLGEGAKPPERLRLNVGAWDNDGDLFSELHSWAPTTDASLWGEMVLEATH